MLLSSIVNLESSSEMNSSGLNDLAKVMAEKQPGSIKEVVKVLTELVTKLDSFSSDIKSDVARISTSNGEIRSEITGLQRSVQFLSEGFEKFKLDVEAFRGELSAVRADNEQCHIESELLKKELKRARSEITELKQYSRNMNVEIQGFPVVPDEDLLKEVGKLAGYLKAGVTENDIDVVHRVPSRDKSRPYVVVKFRLRAARDRMLSAARKRKLNARDLGYDTDASIYVNEHLCRENKILLAKARQARKENKWKFIWVSQGKVLMRKLEKTPVLRITCEEDLAQVV